MKLAFQRGQAMTEYIVIAAVLLAGVLTPAKPPAGLKCPLSAIHTRAKACNVVQMLRASMQTEQSGFLYAASLPPQPGSQ